MYLIATFIDFVHYAIWIVSPILVGTMLYVLLTKPPHFKPVNWRVLGLVTFGVLLLTGVCFLD